MDIGQVLLGAASGILMGIPTGVYFCEDIRRAWYRLIGQGNDDRDGGDSDAEHTSG